MQEAITNDKPDEARMYLSLARTFGYAINPPLLKPNCNAWNRHLNTARRNVNDFAAGFIDGNAIAVQVWRVR